MASGFDEPRMIIELEAEFGDMPLPPLAPKTTLDAATGIAAAIVDNYTPAAGITDHGDLSNRDNDAKGHSIYGLLAGRAGGQVKYGGTGDGDDHIIRSTSHANKGNCKIQGAADTDVMNISPAGIHSFPETSGFSARTDAGQLIQNITWTPVVFEDEEADTRGEYSSATGRFTALEKGWYQFNWSILSASVLWAATGKLESSLMRENLGAASNNWAGIRWIAHAAVTTYASTLGSACIPLVAGQHVEIKVHQNRGAPTNLYASGSYCYFNGSKAS